MDQGAWKKEEIQQEGSAVVALWAGSGDATLRVADCSTLGFGCTNPSTDGEKCLCKAGDGMKTADDGTCFCDVGYYQVTGASSTLAHDYSCNACTGNMYNNLTS